MKSNVYKVLAVIFIIIVCYGLTLYKRNEQLDFWFQNKTTYFTENYPAMTTLDAYHWLRYADLYGEVPFDNNTQLPLKQYPDGASMPNKVPMLSYMIDKTKGLFDSGNYNEIYIAGIKLTNILGGLLVIPFILYFFSIGFPAAGILGGLIGNFSYSYYVRASTGRVDTDTLNMFFPFFAAYLIYLMDKSKTSKGIYLYSIILGLTMYLFTWWYEHPGFIIVYFAIFVFFLLIKKVRWKVLGISSLLFILFSYPLNFYRGIFNLYNFIFGNYIVSFFSAPESKSIAFPNILQTITESQKKGISEVIEMMIGNQFLGIAGLILAVAFLIYKWRSLLPLLPMFGLGCLAFYSSNRFSMFLAPFIGVGIGFFVDMILKYGTKYINLNKLNYQVISVPIAFIIFFLTTDMTAYDYIPRPSISRPITQSFLDLKRQLPKHSAVFTWWDYGYAIMDIAELATYHDGGAHGGARTYFVAKGFTSDNQSIMHNIITYIDNKGFDSISDMIKDNKSPDYMLDHVLNYNDNLTNKNTYVYYTNDMIGKYGAMSFFGNWDFNKRESDSTGYQAVNCSSMKNNVLQCRGMNIDLNQGVLNMQSRNIPLKRIDFVDGGYIKDTQKFGFESNLNVIVITNDRYISGIYIVRDEVYDSNFNQQFVLGNYDKSKFEEVYNNFPVARAFRVK